MVPRNPAPRTRADLFKRMAQIHAELSLAERKLLVGKERTAAERLRRELKELGTELLR
jgi:hypothetical protein